MPTSSSLQDASASTLVEGSRFNSQILKWNPRGFEAQPFVVKKRGNIEMDKRLVTQNGIDVRLEKVKRKARKTSQYVNGQYYPSTTEYGYRITSLPVRMMTLNELRELAYNLDEFLKSER
jgi:hypothetical protein